MDDLTKSLWQAVTGTSRNRQRQPTRIAKRLRARFRQTRPAQPAANAERLSRRILTRRSTDAWSAARPDSPLSVSRSPAAQFGGRRDFAVKAGGIRPARVLRELPA